MKILFVGACVLFFACGAFAQNNSTVEKLLPNVLIRDAEGRVTNTENLRNLKSWVLIVADASLPSTRTLLLGLNAKNEVYDQHTTVLLIGSESQITELSSTREKLVGLRWVYSSEPYVIKSLGLPGAPSILGIRADGGIAWQFSGLPSPVEKLSSMVQEWLLNPS